MQSFDFFFVAHIDGEMQVSLGISGTPSRDLEDRGACDTCETLALDVVNDRLQLRLRVSAQKGRCSGRHVADPVCVQPQILQEVHLA